MCSQELGVHHFQSGPTACFFFLSTQVFLVPMHIAIVLLTMLDSSADLTDFVFVFTAFLATLSLSFQTSQVGIQFGHQ